MKAIVQRKIRLAWQCSRTVAALMLIGCATSQGTAEAQTWTSPPTESEVEYYHTDAGGTVRLLTRQDGSVAARYDYTPFGTLLGAPTQLDRQRRGFIGREHDDETALDYFGARYYDSARSRFTTVDPVMDVVGAAINPQRWNRYAYAGNNPFRFTDPSGEDFWDFVNGVSDAMRANLLLGAGRSNSLNPDFRAGQFVGDLTSLVAGGYETINGASAMAGGVAACGTGVGCVAGAPVVAGGAIVATHGVGMSVAASVSLMSRAAGKDRPQDTGGGGTPEGGLSNKDARARAADLGYTPTKDAPFDSHGRAVFKKGNSFITADRDMHSGGTWKMFDRQGKRIGTFTEDLSERIGK